MRLILTISIISVLIFLSSCGQKNQNSVSDSENDENINKFTMTKPTFVDYKDDFYNIAIGECYKKSYKIIDWQWDDKTDPDGKLDSTGIDAFVYYKEPRIKYNNGEFQPVLYIKTKNNIITAFSCSIIFEIETNYNARKSFLSLISKDINQLKNGNIVDSLITKGNYQKDMTDYTEEFEFVKEKELDSSMFGYAIESDIFRYSIKLK